MSSASQLSQSPPNNNHAITSPPSPKPPIAPFPRDSAAAVWALLPFRQRLFSYLGSKDQVTALTISRGSFGEACRAVFFELDLEAYRKAKPEVFDPARLATYRRAVRIIRCSRAARDLRNRAQLSDLLVTYPHTVVVSDEKCILTLRRTGGEISDAELSTALEIRSSKLAMWTNTTSLILLPPLWKVKRTYRLKISQGDDRDYFMAFMHLQQAWEDRQGIFKEHITELNVAFPVQLAAFSPCYVSARSMADKGHPPPSILVLQVIEYCEVELSELGAACAGFVRELSISPASGPNRLRTYPDEVFFETVDWNSFRGLQRLSIVVSDDLADNGSVVTLGTPTSPHPTGTASASTALFIMPRYPHNWTFRPFAYPHLSLNHFSLLLLYHSTEEDFHLNWIPQSDNAGVIPSQVAKAMLAIGGPACEYQVRAATPFRLVDRDVVMFGGLMTSLVRREISLLLDSDLDRDRKIGWRKGGRNEAKVAGQD